MQVAQFVTTYAVRSPHIMWFLGAGASVSAGIPTAWDMIWDFKRKLYCTVTSGETAGKGSGAEEQAKEAIFELNPVCPGFFRPGMIETGSN